MAPAWHGRRCTDALLDAIGTGQQDGHRLRIVPTQPIGHQAAAGDLIPRDRTRDGEPSPDPI
jgi:hypothetical protein